MGFARVGSNPTVVDTFCCRPLRRGCPSGAMDSASDFGSGGWGFESPLGLNFAYRFTRNLLSRVHVDCKFGRVVKALALGASLERGMGSNPIACNTFYSSRRSWAGPSLPGPTRGGVAHSVERSVRNRQAQGSKPCSSIREIFLVTRERPEWPWAAHRDIGARAPMVYR
jgi:hypothetical protein